MGDKTQVNVLYIAEHEDAHEDKGGSRCGSGNNTSNERRNESFLHAEDFAVLVRHVALACITRKL